MFVGSFFFKDTVAHWFSILLPIFFVCFCFMVHFPQCQGILSTLLNEYSLCAL